MQAKRKKKKSKKKNSLFFKYLFNRGNTPSAK